MDMSNAYVSWAERHFPKARIVFDHFHVIKLMNERLDKLRRRYVAELDVSQRIHFNKLRMLFLRNMEDLDADSLFDSQEYAKALHGIERRLYAEKGIEKHLCNRIQCPRGKDGVSPLGHAGHYNGKQGADCNGKDYPREITRNHHLLDLRTDEQCINRRIQQQDPMAHAAGIWLPRRILPQIEEISATLNSTSKGAPIYGLKRRKGKKMVRSRGLFSLCARTSNSTYSDDFTLKNVEFSLPHPARRMTTKG